MINYNDSSAGANERESASNIYVTITAVPEPSAATLLATLAVFALRSRKR